MCKKQPILISLLLILIFTSCNTNAALSNAESADPIAATETLPPTITPTATITPTPEPEYMLCPNIEDFRDCFVPVEELLDGSYWNWLNDVISPTLLPGFKEREDKIKDIEMDTIGLPIDLDSNGEILTGSAFIYDTKTRPNFEDQETAHFNRDVTFGFTTWTESDGSTTLYIVLPVFYYDKKTQQVYPVTTLYKVHNEGALGTIDKKFKEDLNIPLIVIRETTGRFTKESIVMEDPIVGQFYDNLGQAEIFDRFMQFGGGDVSALSGPDMVFLSRIAKSNFFR